VDTPELLITECTREAVRKEAQKLSWIPNPQATEDQILEMCGGARQAFLATDEGAAMTMEQVLQKDSKFVDDYFLGMGDWNLQTETNSGRNRLKTDAAIVREAFEEYVEERRMTPPAWMQQCQLGAAMCCWSRDRQANDNNGNCATPYSQNCVAGEPADNTDLCYADYSRSSRSNKSSGMVQFKRQEQGCYTIQSKEECCQNIDGRTDQYGGQKCIPALGDRFSSGFVCEPENWVDRNDPSNKGSCVAEAMNLEVVGEKEIHCHGLAWEGNDDSSPTYAYRANTLYFVSLYDHLYTRGYVENVAGAPMCGCLEEMPTVSRSDCSYPEVDEEFRVRIEANGEVTKMSQLNVEIDFEACNGNTANDLYSYVRDRLEYDETIAQPYLVGPSNNNQESNCAGAIAGMVAENVAGMSTAERAALCLAQRNTKAGRYTCGQRIDWLQNVRNYGEQAAMDRVADEFPAECGACASN